MFTFQGVSSRAYEQSDKIDFRMFFLWNHHLIRNACHRWLVVDGRLKLRIQSYHLLNHDMTFFFQLASCPIFARVQTLTIRPVNWLRRR
jgi:hypothetical protein